MPACSNASYATSSNSRCWGSILTASRGEISKNSASKASTSAKNEPHRVVPDNAAAASGEPSSNSDHRSGGTSPTDDRPSHRNRHNDSGPAMSPGKRHPRPMTAIGSSNDDRSQLTTGSAVDSGSEPLRNRVRALIVGCCQNSTGEIDRPSSSDISPQSTIASLDPTARSFKGTSKSMSSGLQPTFVTR